MTRVQIPAYTDAWMRGDRFGEIVKVTKSRVIVKNGWLAEIAHVRLDKSGKRVRVILDDCEVVE